jgi:hypothetical protein
MFLHMHGILGAMLVRLLLAVVVAAVGSPRGVAVHVERIVGARVDFEVSFPQGQPERFVGYTNHGRVSWLTACFMRESYGKLCGKPPAGALGPVPQAILPARFANPRLPGLVEPGTLAVLPDGSLLIADQRRDELYRRSPDGSLHAVLPIAGWSAALAVTPDGAIYIGGAGRIHVLEPSGALRTLAPRFRQIRSLAVARNGTLYVGASQSVVALQDGRERTVVRGVGRFDQMIVGGRRFGGFSPDSLAVGGNGDLYVYSSSTKQIFEVAPSGKPIRFWQTYAHGLAEAPDGSIVIGTQEGTLQRIRGGKLSTIVELAERQPFGFPFQEDGVAVGANGAIYTDTDVGNGYANQSALAEIEPNGGARLLRTTTPLGATFPAGYRASACPSTAGVQPFDRAARAAAMKTARWIDMYRFDRALKATDPSWWSGYYTDQIDGLYEGSWHRIYVVQPASADPYSGAVAQRCGSTLLSDSLAIVVGPGVYSDQVSHMFFLDRGGRALLYWQHT